MKELNHYWQCNMKDKVKRKAQEEKVQLRKECPTCLVVKRTKKSTKEDKQAQKYSINSKNEKALQCQHHKNEELSELRMSDLTSKSLIRALESVDNVTETISLNE